MVEDVLGDYELTIREAEAEVDVQADVTLEADGSQLRQLMTHLIGNALKYRREDVSPSVRISATLIHDEQVLADGPACRITVEDNGIGFEEKYLDRIFEPFQRLHGREAYEGPGMGLALCRRIVERHRGIITAESTPGQGSRFIVLLPAYMRGAAYAEFDRVFSAYGSAALRTRQRRGWAVDSWYNAIKVKHLAYASAQHVRRRYYCRYHSSCSPC